MAITSKTYEINWRSGKTETLVADSVSIPYSPGEGSYLLNTGDSRQRGVGHFRFFKEFVLVLSAAESEVRSVCLITEQPKGATRSVYVDGRATQVEERWIERAKILVRCYGTISSDPAKMLTKEMGLVPHSTGLPYTLVGIAQDEIREEDNRREAAKYCHHHFGRYCGH